MTLSGTERERTTAVDFGRQQARKRTDQPMAHALPNVSSETDWRDVIARLMKTAPQGEGASDGDLARLSSLSCAHTMETTRFTVRGERVTRISVKREMGSTETRTSRNWCGGNASA